MNLLVIASVIFIVGPSFQGKAKKCKKPTGYAGDWAECVNGRWTRRSDHASLERIEKGVEMNGQKLDELQSGKGECGMMVWGRSYGDEKEDFGPLMWSAYHVVTKEKDFWYQYPAYPSFTNYWLTGNGKTGVDARLFIAFDCTTTIQGFLIKNTHNYVKQSRGTNSFKIFTSTSDSGPWTEILSNSLPDARNVDSVPVLRFPLASPITTQYIMFQIESYFGLGGGLQYFATY